MGLLITEERIHLALGAILRIAIAFLQKPHELFAVPVDLVKLVVGELAPLRTNFALQLKPFAFQDISVHESILLTVRPEQCLPVELARWREHLRKLQGSSLAAGINIA